MAAFGPILCANAATITVCWDGSGDHTRIQDALSAASDGDEIVVCDGTYSGPNNVNLDFAGKAILMRSSGGPGVCTIDGLGSQVAFVFDDGETAGAVVRGFTVTNCADVSSGGAVKCEGSSPRFVNCRFTGNLSEFTGGAVMVSGAGGGSTAEFVNCVFRNNSAAGGGMQAGGACSVGNGATPRFTNCTFADNSAVYGGAAYVAESSPVFIDCTWESNHATVYAGAILVERESDATLNDCSFAFNTTDGDGGAAVVYAATASFSNCTLDANGATGEGGAVWVDTDAVTSVVSFTNCNMGGNSADTSGGAVRILGACQASFDGGSITGNVALGGDGGAIASSDGSDVTTAGITFVQNFAAQQGGVLFSDGSTATVTDCQLTGNSANSRGGAIANVASSMTVSTCTFDGNTTGGVAGAMVNDSATADILNCSFLNNISADRGGGLFNAASTDVLVQDCTFADNWLTGASGRGGAISNGQSPVEITRCLFQRNRASAGGGIHNFESDATITDCLFESNDGGSAGGGVFNSSSSPLISWSGFHENVAHLGGGLYNTGSLASPVIHNCEFLGNLAGDYGGGVYCGTSSSSVVELANCLFSGNRAGAGAGGSGGAIRVEDGDVNVINCTLSRNHADTFGGGVSVYAFGLSTVDIDNSILWENDDSSGITYDAQIHLVGVFALMVDYSCVYDWPGGGTGNIDCHASDPTFTDPNGGDGTVGTPDDNLHLLKWSPCVDAADNAAVPADTTNLDGDSDWGEPTPLDLDAKERFIEDPTVVDTGSGTPPMVDMGSYERCPGDLDGDGDTDQGDLGILLADWGCTGGCPGDLDGDGDTGQPDLGILLADWGCGT